MYRLESIEGTEKYIDQVLDVTFEVPQGWKGAYTQTPPLNPIEDEKIVEDAIKNPKFGLSLQEIVKKKQAKNACVLVSDATRAVPTSRQLRFVVEELVDAGMAYEDIHAFVAIGVHRDATEEEMKRMLGDLYGKISIENHTPFDKDKLIYLGDTSTGTPVWVNKRAYECDLHIQIGKVEPHEFAGFSGGRKSVLPGISAEDTIIINHRPEMILHEKAAIGVLEGNPVHIDMVETAEWFGIDFAVNCILNNNLELSAVFAGELVPCHEAAIQSVREILGVTIEKQPEILVTTPGNPLDIDFYQTVKALIALTEVLNENTVVVLYCGCPEGVNSPDMLRAFGSSKDLEEVVAFTTENYKIQMDHVLLLSKIFRKNVKIVLCCPNVTDEEAEQMFMIPAHSPEEALQKAMELSGKEEGTILFYPRPQTGLPVLKA